MFLIGKVITDQFLSQRDYNQLKPQPKQSCDYFHSHEPT